MTYLAESLQVDIKYSLATIEWDDAEVPMQPRDATFKDAYYINDMPCLQEAANQIKEILDAKYKAANLDEFFTSSTHLSFEEQQQLKTLMLKY
jgi:hypothetical protein